jgi:hypothetical protein
MKKIFNFLLIIGLFFSISSAFSQEQKISLDIKNCSVIELFKVMQGKTNLYFVYNIKNFESVGKFDVKANNETVSSLLSRLFGNIVTFEYEDNTVVVKPKTKVADPQKNNPKEITIAGRVIDESHDPLAGATVRLKGNNTFSVFADNDGRYTLTLPFQPPVSLIYSFIGKMPKEITFHGDSILNTILKESPIEIEDVVVNGYMTVDKGSYVGAIYSVKIDEIKVAGETSIDQMLQGVVPGLSVWMSSGRGGATPK